MKIVKRKKSSRMHGRNMGTHGGGARCKNRKSGNKETLVLKKYGHGYFGKKGITSKKTQRKKEDKINVGDIQGKLKAGEVDLSNYKILGKGEVKDKFIIKARAASKSAIEKVRAKEGEIILGKKKIKKEIIKEK